MLFDYLSRLIDWAEANPVLFLGILGIVWPALTGLASLGYHKLEERFPRLIAFLRASGLDIPTMAKAALQKAWPARLPKPPGMMCLCLALAVFFIACKPEQLEAVTAAAEAGRDIAAAAEPCFVDHRDRMLATCAGDKTCEAGVRDAYKPIADAFDAFRAAWCTVSPSSEGC